MNKIEYKELITFHPGYYVKDYMEDQGITQDELAKRLQTSSKNISELVNGKTSLSDEMVQNLSIVFGTSTTMWLNLNKKYIEKKIEINYQRELDRECDLVRLLKYKFWVDLELVKPVKSTSEKVHELQRYFKVSSLNVLRQRNFLVQYRTGISKVTDKNVINANAWVQTAINIGSEMEVHPFDKKKLSNAIPDIRNMTVQKPSVFYPRLKELLASCGVALVLLPTLTNSGVNGAVKWLGKDKVVLALNDRRKYADTFWFSLFHELGHVMQQRVKVLMICEKNNETLETSAKIEQLEKEADKFAQETLIHEADYQSFIDKSSREFSSRSIEAFSKQINIQPGIVVGRLQKDEYLEYQTNLNSLKKKYEINFSR